MRAADATTILRTLLVLVAVYLIIISKVNTFLAYPTIILIAVIIAMDGLDGYLAVREESKGGISFTRYLAAAIGNTNSKAKEQIKKIKQSISKHAPHGARMDVAGDRVVEYSLWIVFVYLHVLPIWVLLIVVIRHSFVDTLMAAKGTSSKMKTGFAKFMYSSNIARSGINVLKFVTFSYLILMYAYGYPALIGYILTAALVIYILARGAAEVYESMQH